MVPSIPKVEKKARRFAPRQRAYGLRPSSWGDRPCLGLRPKRVQTSNIGHTQFSSTGFKSHTEKKVNQSWCLHRMYQYFARYKLATVPHSLEGGLVSIAFLIKYFESWYTSLYEIVRPSTRKQPYTYQLYSFFDTRCPQTFTTTMI